MIVFRLSPELADGEHWTIVETVQAVQTAIIEHLKSFAREDGGHLFDPGDEFSVEVVEMTEAELAALKDI